MRAFVFVILALVLPLAAAHSQTLSRTQGPGDQNWDTRFGPPAAGGLGLNGSVSKMVELPNGDLIATGFFRNAGADPNADYIARWDGTAWHALGTGLNEGGIALTLAPNGDVIVGGRFTAAGGVANTGKIARWDGTAWHAVGTGVSGTQPGVGDDVNALIILPNGDLLAGGRFANMGGNPAADYLARWDGIAWTSFATPLFAPAPFSPRVNDLALAPNGDLVAGGVFTCGTGIVPSQNLARWDGTVWQTIGADLNSEVYSTKFTPNGDLFVAGWFTDIGGVPGTGYVARWDGTSWNALGAGLGTASFVLAACPNGDLLVGGLFVDAGGNPAADHIARWDGTAWQPLGTGLAATSIESLYVTTTGDYMVGGLFTSVGDGSVPMQNFGIYHVNRVGLTEDANAPTTLHAYPNPAHSTLQVPLPAQFSGALTLLDATGRIVRSLAVTAGTTAATMDLHNVAPGLYVLRAGAAGQRVVVE